MRVTFRESPGVFISLRRAWYMGVMPVPAASSVRFCLPLKGYWILTLPLTCLNATLSPIARLCRYCEAAPLGYRFTRRSKEPGLSESEMGVYLSCGRRVLRQGLTQGRPARGERAGQRPGRKRDDMRVESHSRHCAQAAGPGMCARGVRTNGVVGALEKDTRAGRQIQRHIRRQTKCVFGCVVADFMLRDKRHFYPCRRQPARRGVLECTFIIFRVRGGQCAHAPIAAGQPGPHRTMCELGSTEVRTARRAPHRPSAKCRALLGFVPILISSRYM
eukprot:scaffold10028_cov236-Isochrysis_galbana.AAC.8